MPINLPTNSRYRNAEPIKFEGKTTIGRWPKFSWLDSPSIRTFKVPARLIGRLDLISFEVYGTPDYWWVIMYYNNQTDINWPRSGDIVRIPDINLVIGTT